MQIVKVNFKKGGKVYDYLTNGLTCQKGDKVVVETPKGLEIATVVMSNQEVDESIAESKVVRIATEKDLEKQKKLYLKQEEVRKKVEKAVEKYQLHLKIVSIDFPFEGNKIVISFLSEDRVDFRELVKDLAQQLKSRIELKQIGVRDQVKEIGAIGVCGKETCCKQYLSDFDKVSIKMAKNQNLSLTPSKISGMCGRLMCCLAFEDEHYQAIAKKMPKMGSIVTTPAGEGTVYYNDILKEMVTVKMIVNDMPKLVVYAVSDLTFPQRTQEGKVQSQKEITSQELEKKSEPAKNKKRMRNKKHGKEA